MKKLATFLLALVAVALPAQTHRITTVDLYTGDPTGVACTPANKVVQSTTTGLFYSCVGGFYANGTLFNGGTVTNPIALPADPTLPLQAATKQYVDNHGGNSPDAGTQVFNVKAYGALGNDSHDDTSAINSAKTAAAAAGGAVYFPAGFYKITAPITWASGVSIRGVGPVIQAIANTNPDLNMIASAGSWLDCNSQTNCLTGSNLRSVNIEHMGFENWTGQAITFGGDGVDGISFANWDDVIFIGLTSVNGSDVGIRLNNVQHLEFVGVRVYNTNTCLDVINQNKDIAGANSELVGFYCKTYGKSVANGNNAKGGIQLRTLAPTVGSPSPLNYIHFVRAQVNSFNGDGTGTNVIIQGLSNAKVTGITFEQTDLEGTFANGFYADYCLSCFLQVSEIAQSTAGAQTFNITSNSGPVHIDSSDGSATLTIPPLGVVVTGVYKDALQTNQYGIFMPQTSGLVNGRLNGPFTVGNGTAATSGLAQYSQPFNLCGNYWNGSVSGPDCFLFQNAVSNGTNPNVNFNVTHSGTTNTAFFNFTGMTVKLGTSFNVDASGNTNIGSGIFLNPSNGAANVNSVAARTAANPLSLSVPGAVGSAGLSGCSFSGQVGGTWAGKFASGTAGTCTVVITPGITAGNGFSCWANDLTTTADKINQTATTTTTATIAGTTASADVITWGCVAY
jgi:hypothetical protein